MGIVVPDEGWDRFVRKLWGPFVVDGAPDDAPPFMEVAVDPLWGGSYARRRDFLGKARTRGS